MANVVEVTQLTKRYRNGRGVANVTFQLAAGQCLALCGGNGAGKSTTIKALILQHDCEGDIRFNGVERRQRNAFLQQFAYMPDHMVFPAQLTAVEVLTFFQQVAQSTVSIDEQLRRVGLFDVRHEKVGSYSKGMQQRLSLAQLLVKDAPVLLLDEPTNGLDPFWIYQFHQLVTELKAQGKAIIYSTHLISMVEHVADELLFIEEGTVKLQQSVEQLRALEPNESLETIIFNQLFATPPQPMVK